MNIHNMEDPTVRFKQFKDTTEGMLDRTAPENEEYFWHLSSKPPFSEFPDSTDRNYIISLAAKLSTEEIPTEIISMQRRRNAARQALMGKIPANYTILFQRGPVPTPLSAIAHLDQNSPTRRWAKSMFGDDSNLIPPPCFSEGVSYRESFILSKAPPLSTLGHLGKETMESQAPVNSDLSKAFLLAETTKEQLNKTSFDSPDKKNKAKPVGYQPSKQPGSNIKVVLPPIPQCRKYANA
ncbi:leucine-rich repeat and guanylate kinase domain-containing protein-like [Macrotis lagotis]|uniref:leucine-rich repeat and guanylate kinase domain-containing protein-like n=1 Tax=Macrotis lagotis TaxID=92651 RepID=UPI003D69EF43